MRFPVKITDSGTNDAFPVNYEWFISSQPAVSLSTRLNATLFLLARRLLSRIFELLLVSKMSSALRTGSREGAKQITQN